MYYQENADPNQWEANYEREMIPPYTLPDLLTCQDGTRVTDPDMWNNKRKKEILSFFRNTMYGEIPPLPDTTEKELLSEGKVLLPAPAIRREFRLTFRMQDGRSHSASVLLFLPENAPRQVPCFVGLTFMGNHVVSPDPTIHLSGLRGKAGGIPPEEAEKLRGDQARRFPLHEILTRGYALMTASYHDFFPDRPDGWEESIYYLFHAKEEMDKVQYSASAISAWAWGVSRLADLAESVPEIDGKKLACYGHSRLGKTSLWAGANDERFSLVCVNDSGCGGAALSRRLFGETLYCMCHINNMGYWYRKDLWPMARTPEKLEMDQHGLIALVAPRAVSVHSATEDRWADPEGEYLSAYHAGKVYSLLGKTPLADDIQPEPGREKGSDVSYLLRQGRHDILLEDWTQYMNIADRIF